MTTTPSTDLTTTLLAALVEAPPGDWACTLGLAAAALALCGAGALVARQRRRTPTALYLPTRDTLVRLVRGAENLTLQDVARLVWPHLPWREAIQPWAIFPLSARRLERHQPASVERLEPAVWLLRRLAELAQAGEVPYVPAYAGRAPGRR